MTMTARSCNTAIFIAGFCFSLFSFVNTDSPSSSCPGPIQYYTELGCTPVFKNPNSPCPERYNCDHLKNLPTDKCFLNGHEYAIGEALRDEDRNPCDIGCFCSENQRGPQFTCAIVDCFYGVQPGCYLKRKATSCCGGPLVCPENQKDIPTCTVDGRKYNDGEYFVPASEPEKTCFCGEGYTGENVEPFCVTPQRNVCGTMLRHSSDVRENCVPTYYYNQSPKSSCSVAYRCQNDKDVVIPRTPSASDEAKVATSEPIDPAMTCNFGNLTMHVGDELNQATDYSSVCMKCVCEVPPIPTCQRLPDEECDITKHPNFDSR